MMKFYRLLVFCFLLSGTFQAYGLSLLDPLVFDPTHYAAYNPDLGNAGLDTVEELQNHWQNVGVYEGRQATPNFWVQEYRDLYPDLKNAFGNNFLALVSHYLNYGYNEGRAGRWVLFKKVFNPEEYLAKNPDLFPWATSEESLKQHWVLYGANEGRIACKTFFTKEYRDLYPDLKAAFGNNFFRLAEHYVQAGISEGRVGRWNLHPLVFRVGYYADLYADVAALDGESRKADWIDSLENNRTRAAHPCFNVTEYLQMYPDLLQAYGQDHMAATEHYVRWGFAEGRVGNLFLQAKYFNYSEYLSFYPELQGKTLEDAQWHWMMNGLRQGKKGSSQFNIRQYLKKTQPLLGRFFGMNWELAWKHHMLFEKGGSEPHARIPLATTSFDEEGRMVYNVDLYVSDRTDAAAGISACVLAAKQFTDANPGSKALVKFGTGEYVLKGLYPPETRYVFTFKKLKNILISGTGNDTLIKTEDPLVGVFEFKTCENFYLKDLRFDKTIRPFVQGPIVAKNSEEGYFDVALDNIPHAGIEYFNDTEPEEYTDWGVLYDSKDRMTKKDVQNFMPCSRVEPQDEDTWRFYPRYASGLGDAAVGDLFAFVSNSHQNAVMISQTTNAGLHNLEFNGSSGGGCTVRDSEGELILDQVIVKAPAGKENYLVSTNRDAVALIANRAPILIQNCYFEKMGDDAINIRTGGRLVQSGNAALKQVTLYETYPMVRVGDRIQFYDPVDGRVLMEPQVTAIGMNGQILTFDQWHPDIVGGGAEEPSIRSPYPNTVLYNLSACGANSVISNNIFGPLRGRHALIRPPGVQILGNDFLQMDSISLTIMNEVRHFVEGPVPSNVRVEGNRFNGGRSRSAQLDSHVAYFGSENHPLYAISLDVRNNEFFNSPSHNILFDGMTGLTLTGNTFSADGREDRRHPGSSVFLSRGSVLENGETVEADNTFQDRRTGVTANAG